MELNGRTILLTGATGGIGAAIARACAAAGGRLLLTGRRTEVLEPLAREVGGTALACDLGSREQVAQLLDQAQSVEILIANAALPASGLLTDLSQDEIDRMLEVNLRAPIALARGLAEQMAKRGGGHLVFVSSLAGKAASPASSVYSATKFGLRGFAHALAYDVREQGIGVTVVLPGFISDAGMFADSRATLPRGVGTRTPEQVADAVVRAIRRGSLEVEVAPLGLRIGASIGGLAPRISAVVSRRLGGGRIAAAVAEGQRDKRV